MEKHTDQKRFIPFASPQIGEQEITLVTECLRSGWLTSGVRVREFEEQFSDFIGNNTQAIAVNSATSGLMLALEACGVKAGDEVITTPYTFSATAMSTVYLNAKPVLVDIDPVTLNINHKLIESAITDKTKAIVPVHIAGLPCNMLEIISLARKYNLKIIEDAAHALPTIYNGKIIGSLDSDATVYSFYATKTITTGEGGMICTQDSDIAQRIRTMRMHGISADVFDRYTSTKPKWYYEIQAPGWKCNMTDIAASIGIPQLAKANQFHKKREYIWQKYTESFKDLPVILPADTDALDNNQSPYQHSYHLFVIRLNQEVQISRNEFIEIMSSKYKIGCSVHFIPLNLHPFWQDTLKITKDHFPAATKAYNNAVSLPLYTSMTDEDIQRVITAVRSILLGI